MSKINREEYEMWKDIKGYEGLYQVSNLGRVHSLDRYVPRKTGTVQKVHGRILKLPEDKDGYSQVSLWKRNKMKKAKAHRLVGEAFIPNPNNLPEINHKNEVKNDNRVSNLEWCTRKENINHGTRSEQVAKTISSIDKWINETECPMQTLASLRLGYEVEKEPKYRLKLNGDYLSSVQVDYGAEEGKPIEVTILADVKGLPYNFSEDEKSYVEKYLNVEVEELE